jgi:hypothetical protein
MVDGCRVILVVDVYVAQLRVSENPLPTISNRVRASISILLTVFVQYL